MKNIVNEFVASLFFYTGTVKNIKDPNTLSVPKQQLPPELLL